MVLHCTPVLPGTAGQRTNARRGPKGAQALNGWNSTMLDFESDLSFKNWGHLVEDEVHRQTGLIVAFYELHTTVQAAGTLFRQPISCTKLAEYNRLLEELAKKKGAPVNVYVDVEVEPPAEAAPHLSDALSQAVGNSLARAVTTTSTATAQSAPKRSKAAQEMHKTAELLRSIHVHQKALEESIPVCVACRSHRNADVRCWIIPGTSLHHPLDHALVFEWASEIANERATADRPPDRLLVRSLDRSPAARGRHVSGSSQLPQASPATIGSPAPSQSPSVAIMAEGEVQGHHQAAVTPSPLGRQVLGQLGSNALSAGPAEREGPDMSVWKFVELLGQGGEELAARVTLGRLRTMKALARAKERLLFSSLSLQKMDLLEIDGWLDDWRCSKFEDESVEERQQSVRIAEDYGRALLPTTQNSPACSNSASHTEPLTEL